MTFYLKEAYKYLARIGLEKITPAQFKIQYVPGRTKLTPVRKEYYTL